MIQLQPSRLHQRIEPQPVQMLRQPVKLQSAFQPVHHVLLSMRQVCAGSGMQITHKTKGNLGCV